MTNSGEQSKSIVESLLREESPKCIDTRYLALYLARLDGEKRSNMQLLPLLYDLLGENLFISLLRVFAGMYIRFPTERSLSWSVRDVFIWNEVSSIDSKNRTERSKKFKELSDIFNIKEDKVKRIYRKTAYVFKDFPTF